MYIGSLDRQGLDDPEKVASKANFPVVGLAVLWQNVLLDQVILISKVDLFAKRFKTQMTVVFTFWCEGHFHFSFCIA